MKTKLAWLLFALGFSILPATDEPFTNLNFENAVVVPTVPTFGFLAAFIGIGADSPGTNTLELVLPPIQYGNPMTACSSADRLAEWPIYSSTSSGLLGRFFVTGRRISQAESSLAPCLYTNESLSTLFLKAQRSGEPVCSLSSERSWRGGSNT